MAIRLPDRACARASVQLQNLAVRREPDRHHAAGLERALAVAELAYVEVAAPAVDAGRPLPAEEDVARGLHQPLADDDPLAGVAVLGRRVEPFQHRGLGLLRLQDERVVDVAAHEQDDPAAGADAADPDDLAGHVRQPEPAGQDPPLGRQAARVARDQVGETTLEPVPLDVRQQVDEPLDDRRLRDELRPSVHEPGEFAGGL
jgi:hypothetical protein